MVPVFLIEIVIAPLASGDAAPEHRSEHVHQLLDACSSILEEGRCVSSDAVLGADESIQARGRVTWQSERSVSFVFENERSGLVFGQESLVFSALDPEVEWYRALGFALGTTAGRLAEAEEPGSETVKSEASFEVPEAEGEAPLETTEEPNKPVEEPIEPKDEPSGETATGGVAAPSLESDPEAESRWWEEPVTRWALPSWRTSLNLLTGPAFDDGSWRWGAELQQSFGWGRFPLYPVLGGYILSRPDLLGVTWFGVELGAEFGWSPEDWPLGIYGQTLFLIETIRAQGDGSSQGASTFGIKLSAAIQWPRSGWWALRVNGGVNSLFNQTVLLVDQGESTPTRLATSPFQPLIGAGVSLNF